jgi:hypothetical protein
MYNVSITTQINKPPYLSIRKFRKIMKRNHEWVGRTWHKHVLPLHFKQPAAGGGRYGYAARKPKYLAGKRRRATDKIKWRRVRSGKSNAVIEGGRFALVGGGETRHRAVDFPPDIKAFPTRVTVKMHVPKYASMTPKASNKGPNLGKEIAKVLPSEAKALRKQMKKRVVRDFNAARSQNKKTVKV